MWDSFSGKALIIIGIVIIALFGLRILAKQGFKLKKPTWKDLQSTPLPASQTSVPVTNQSIDTLSYGRNAYSW